MSRAIIIVLDSVGCGGAEDAAAYGDEGADTLGHIAEACALGRGNRDGLRQGPLSLPRLDALGLGHVIRASTGRTPPGFAMAPASGQWGYGIETSRGKDTPSGHWEMAGAPVDFEWGYFPRTIPAFPETLVASLVAEGKLPGILGRKHASGTEIIEEFGEEHLRTGKPICYTSANSVFQIAAHEDAFGLERLYDLCRIGRRLCDPLNIGRVIARPFVGGRPRTSSAPPTARISPCRRPTATCCSAPRRPGAQSSRSARSAIFSPIATRERSARARATTAMSISCSTR